MNFKPAFIFDMDGVIADSNPYHKIALKQFCQQHGFDLTEDQLREKIYGRTNKDWIRNIFGSVDTETLKRYADEKEALYRELYKNDIRPVDGLIEFLTLLDAGDFRRAIATSAPIENVDFTLNGTDTTHFFSTILDESFVTQGKPDPEIYLKTAAALKMPAGQCIVFEDSLSGVQSAKAAGCKVVGITTTHTAEELDATHLVITDFTGLTPAEIVSRLFS